MVALALTKYTLKRKVYFSLNRVALGVVWGQAKLQWLIVTISHLLIFVPTTLSPQQQRQNASKFRYWKMEYSPAAQ